MLFNFILDLLFSIFKLFLAPFNLLFLNITPLFKYLYSFFVFINSSTQILDLVIDMKIAYMILLAIFTINNLELIINIVIWILKKIPFVGIK